MGVTPFVALAQALATSADPVTLIYCVRDRANAAHLEELETLAAAKPNLTLIVWQSQQRGRLTAAALAQEVDDLAKRKVLFCGPIPMRRSLSKDLPAQGVAQKNFHYEEFEIRTGIGLRRMVEWLWQRHLSKST